MLIEILNSFGSRKTQSMQHLAQKLDISDALLRQMIYQLIRTGYLMPAFSVAVEGCGQQCAKKSCAGCLLFQQLSLTGWVLTEKGKRYLEQAKINTVAN